jgi:acetyltransferase
VTKNKLRQVLPSTASVNNPVDIIGDALMDRYKQSLDILCADKKVGGIIVMLTPQKMTEIEETAKILKNYKNKKPITAVFIGGSAMDEAKKIFIQEKIANYTCPSKVIEALDYLHTGTDQKKRQSAKSSKIGQQKSLDFLQSRQLLKTAGINLTGIFIEKKLDLTEKLKNIKYPIAMKVVSDQVLHKSDAGGVKVNIKNLFEAMKAWDEIVKKIQQNVKKAKIDGMVVQTMASGKEVIIGMLRDKTFGPVIIFGLGGIFVEILQDSSMRLAPVSESEAKKMILEIKASPFLTGVRGQKPVNIKALAKIITAVSVLAIKNPEIQEIDLNPVMVNETSAEVVDWRIINP